MTNYEINEVMAQEIAEILKKYDLFNETQIFYNQKMMTYDYEKQESIIQENIELADYADHGNPDMITIQYQGENSLYMIVNGFADGVEEVKRCNRIVSELIKLGEKHNRWYELGSKNNLYYVSDEDDVYTTERFDFTKKAEFPN
ncbi:MAG: hypothetical protein PWP16_1713 [Eubacteriaceae bacterium]|jgi:tetrahydromethanopterin S-methyltransferase subunit H|nr:hypothetical protein [Eubacteriaceae bacterium]MDK2905236.1 hypothetical protein [Eubacteriaceae bacterium]MDK2935254.1 hypothetical protein [Eubacteriaceae bacterium]MDN5308350.1 hypothetical protein [Eubacteriaceae bacterium]